MTRGNVKENQGGMRARDAKKDNDYGDGEGQV